MKNIRDVRVVLYEPDHDIRSAIRGMMRDVGFAEIIDTNRPDRVREAIATGDTDLTIFDVNNGSGTGAMSSLICDMRCNKIGPNPFPIALGMAGDADHQTIKAAVNAGCDGLMLKPLELSVLRKRLEYFLRARKPFVITATYVGPDRHQSPKSGNNATPHLVVPNPVRLIADGMPRDVMMSHVKEATAELNERKLQRDIVGVTWVADKIDKALSANDTDKAIILIKQLKVLAREIDERLVQTAFGHVRKLCTSLLTVSARLEAAGNKPSRKDVKLLINVSQAIKRGCDADTDDEVYAREITESLGADA